MGQCGGKSIAEEVSPSIDGHVFLMVNPSSGGQQASALLDVQEGFEFRTKKNRKLLSVHIFNLKNEESRELGFQAVKKASQDGSDIRVIACGGDGTVKWVIGELKKVDCLHAPLGTIPFGTGNDFSRVIGWGVSAPSPLLGKNLSALKNRVEAFYESQVINLDTWLCDITVHPKSEGGKFVEVKDGHVVETHKDTCTVTHEFINYFSFGADALVSFQFEMERTDSRMGNKLVYVRKGVGNYLLGKAKRVGTFIGAQDGGAGSGLSSNGEEIKLNPKHRILGFFNIPSYAAGAQIWRPGKGRNGTFTKQYVGDRKLESASIISTSGIAGHTISGNRTFPGIQRLAQKDQYDLTFKPSQTNIFLQIDGEPMRLDNPKEVKIRHGFQIKVLKASKKTRAQAYSARFSKNADLGTALNPADPVPLVDSLIDDDALTASSVEMTVSDSNEEDDSEEEDEEI